AGPLAHLFISGHLGHGHVSADAVSQALRALALALPFAALLEAFLGATRGDRDMRATVVVDNIGRQAAQMLGGLLAGASRTAALLAALGALPYVPAAIGAWLWLRRLRKNPEPARGRRMPPVPPELAALLALARPVPSPRTPASTGPGPAHGNRLARRRLANASPRGFWRFTAPRGLASLAQITLQRIDIVLVAIMRGPAPAAVYTAATRFLVAGQLGNTAISNAAQPRLTEFFA